MTRVFTVLSVLAGTTFLPSAVGRADPPAFTLTGNKTISIQIVSINGDTTVTLELVLDKSAGVSVITKDADVLKPFEAAAEKAQKEREKRSKELQKHIEEIDEQLKEAIDKKDEKKIKEWTAESAKATAEFIKDAQATIEVFQSQPAVAEGILAYKDKRWQLVGTMRPFDPDAKDKGGKLGICSVQGEVVTGEFKAGEVKSSVALRAGDLTIVLTGPAAKEAMKGRVRATGALRLGKAGDAVLEATKIETAPK
jgi:hypothetical protein